MKYRFVSWVIGLVLAMVGSLSVANAAPLAELVSMRTEDKVLLHGLHYRPEESSNAVVIHIPGGPGAFYSMQDMAPLAEALNQNGYHFLSINTRTAGANGLMYGIFEDYRWDVQAAVDYARAQDLERIVLLGHSLGSARALYWLSQAGDDAVEAVILSGAIVSPYEESAFRWSDEEKTRYDNFLARQREKTAAGHGRELASYPWFGPRRPPLELSAASWISIFGTPEESAASTVKYADKVQVPVLLLHGADDRAARPDNARAIRKALPDNSSTRLIIMEDTGHLFIGSEKAMAQNIVEWLQTAVPLDAVEG